MAVVQELKDALPTVQHVILHDNLGVTDLASSEVASAIRMSQTTSKHGPEVEAFKPMSLPFDHPLWIVYSSGTTGLPKPIVHGHGGTVIVALALKILHNDVGCSYHPNSWGERFHWYSSTGWVMWNAQVGGLMNGTTCVIYDGNPGGSKDNPDWSTLWRFAAENKVTFFGAGAAFFANCQSLALISRSVVTCLVCAHWAPQAHRFRLKRKIGATHNSNASKRNTCILLTFTVKQMATFGGAIFQAAPIFVVRSLVAIVNCRKRLGSCNAACWVAPWRLGMKRVNLCMAKWVNWCVRSLFHPCLCIFGTTKIMLATWPVILKCTPRAMAANQAVVMQMPRMGVFGGTAIGCELARQSRAKTAAKAVLFLAAAMPWFAHGYQ
jgi:hypothetical protein